MLLNRIEVSVIVEQLNFVGDGHGSYHAVDGFPDGNAFLSQGPVNLCREKKHLPRHGEKNKILKIPSDLHIFFFFPHALQHFRQDQAAHTYIFTFGNEKFQHVDLRC